MKAGGLLPSYSLSPRAGIATPASQHRGKRRLQHRTELNPSPRARTCPSLGQRAAIKLLSGLRAHAQPVPYTNELISQCSSAQPFLQTLRINKVENNYLQTLQLLSRRYLCLCGYGVQLTLTCLIGINYSSTFFFFFGKDKLLGLAQLVRANSVQRVLFSSVGGKTLSASGLISSSFLAIAQGSSQKKKKKRDCNRRCDIKYCCLLFWFCQFSLL